LETVNCQYLLKLFLSLFILLFFIHWNNYLFLLYLSIFIFIYPLIYYTVLTIFNILDFKWSEFFFLLFVLFKIFFKFILICKVIKLIYGECIAIYLDNLKIFIFFYAVYLLLLIKIKLKSFSSFIIIRNCYSIILFIHWKNLLIIIY